MSSKIAILIVDDSLVFRKFLVDIFETCHDLEIAGEAQNGIEALDIMLKTKPDVILLDMEMPLMDGMTALQHLMIHRPTPTIMFSSLTEKGTARCFDTLKNGAVDFVCKDFIFQKNSLLIYKKLLIEKVKKAALVKLKAKEPIFSSPVSTGNAPDIEERVVFCEECGNREVVAVIRHQPMKNIFCSKCGDLIDLGLFAPSQYMSNAWVTVLGGGEGCFFDLLQLVPQLPVDMGGALIAVIQQEVEHVNNFTEYLDAISEIKVLRAREGVNIEKGGCYLASGEDFMSIKPYSAQLTLQKVPKGSLKGGPLDFLLASVSTVFKKRAGGIILSGEGSDGDKGLAILMKNGGTATILNEEECFCKGTGIHLAGNCHISTTSSMEEIVGLLKNRHYPEECVPISNGGNS